MMRFTPWNQRACTPLTARRPVSLRLSIISSCRLACRRSQVSDWENGRHRKRHIHDRDANATKSCIGSSQEDPATTRCQILDGPQAVTVTCPRHMDLSWDIQGWQTNMQADRRQKKACTLYCRHDYLLYAPHLAPAACCKTPLRKPRAEASPLSCSVWSS